jgi:hypothetical protein
MEIVGIDFCEKTEFLAKMGLTLFYRNLIMR